MLRKLNNNKIISTRKGGISPVKYIKEKAGDYQPSPSLDTDRLSVDTTLSKKEVHEKLEHIKRKVINDKDISPRLFEKLKLKCLSLCFDLKQKDIIETLYPLNISNTTMARVINDLVPDAKATQGSVASMIRFLKSSKTSKKMADELDKLLDDIL